MDLPVSNLGPEGQLLFEDKPVETSTADFSRDVECDDEKTFESWTLEAEGGNEESQLKLGQYYLNKVEVSADETDGATNADAIEGVKWLCMASRQGNTKATEELNKALDNQLGVTEGNLKEVKWCIQTSVLDKSAHKAAQKLFQQINSQEETTFQTLDKKEQKLIEKAIKASKEKGGDEAIFVEKIMKRFHGTGGFTLDSLLQNNVEMEAFDNASIFKQTTRYPGKLISVIADRSIDAIGKQGMAWLTRLIPFNQIYMLIAFFFYSLITLDLILWFIPLMTFYVSFGVMSVCTMQMFYSRKKQKDVNVVSNLLSRFNDALDTDSAESAFAWESLTPYGVFAISLVLNVSSFAVADRNWIACSELVCLSVMFFGTCFYALNDSHDELLKLAVGLNVLSTLPTFIEKVPDIPLLKNILVLFVGNIYSFPLFSGLQCNVGLPSLAHVVVPILFAKMATRQSLQGWYRTLIPHLVCFFWWQIAVMLFYYTTWFGLVRASVECVSVCLLLPIIIAFSMLIGLFSLFVFLLSGNFLQVFVTVILLSMPIIVGLIWSKGGLKKMWGKLQKLSFVKGGIFIGLFALMFAGMFMNTPIEPDVKGSYISWEKYRQYCSKPAWVKTNIAHSQIMCSQLKNSIVEWRGNVKKIVVKQTVNKAEDYIEYLPRSLSEWIRCAYGEAYANCSTVIDESERELCHLVTIQGHRTCHLKNMDIYTFEVWVEMPLNDVKNNDASENIRIEASNWFKDSLMHITEGDEIVFRAALKENIGNVLPQMSMFYLRCDTRGVEFGSKEFVSESSTRVLQSIRNGLQSSWNFFFAPLFQFV